MIMINIKPLPCGQQFNLSIYIGSVKSLAYIGSVTEVFS